MRAMQNNGISMNKTWNVRGRLIDLSSPLVMGVINLTPDSFFKGSRHNDASQAVATVKQMISEGADIIDVGGYSSRPGAEDIPVEEELRRTIPVVQAIAGAFPGLLLSIDTFRPEVAKQAIVAGANVVNDISGGDLNDNALPALCATNKLPFIAMHMRGTPQTMSGLAVYDDLLKEVIDHFHRKLDAFSKIGLADVVVDPGFGFAKSVEQNFQLLAHLAALRILGKPIMAGLSRKSMIWRSLDISPEESLNGTTALNMAALMNGATILRVHDVKEARQCVKLWTRMTASVG
jgi:dihydropteroate synthase